MAITDKRGFATLALTAFLTATVATTLFAAGCSTPAPDSEQPSDEEPDIQPDPDLDTDGAIALVEIYALDLWGQYLPTTITELAVTNTEPGADDVNIAGFPVAHIAVKQARSYRVALSADGHHPIEFTVDIADGQLPSTAVVNSVVANGGAVTVSRGSRVLTPDTDAIPTTTLYLGLRHKWFSAQARPARRGNQIDLLMDGEEAWTSVHSELGQATDSVELSTWWWESNFELIRDANHASQSESTRRANTIMSIMDRSPARKRVLVGQFLSQDGFLSSMTVDDELEQRGADTSDNFEFMGQANTTRGVFMFDPASFSFNDRIHAAHGETRSRQFDGTSIIDSQLPTRTVDLTLWPVGLDVQHASWHQKFMVVDGDVAFVGGMNLRRVDWDTSRHEIFEPRRMLFDSTASARQEVVNREELPDTGPRKDYMTRIAGPIVQDASEVFKRRWDTAIADGAEYSAGSTSYDVKRDLAELPGGVQAQITTTMPDPYWEHGIAESWLNAVSQAQRFIFIEDQYFRAPVLNDAIEARMNEVPGLQLIVITKPINEWLDPGCAWTYGAHHRFKSQFPARYQLLQLRAFDTQVTWGIDETESRFADMDVHSKLLIVDDVFLSVGSANKNNRGMVYEGEMNVAVYDHQWVRAARKRVIANILGDGFLESDSVDVWTNQLRDAAIWNDLVRQNWDDEGDDISLDGAPLPTMYAPNGFVYSMDFPAPSECLIESVGPDMT